MNENPLVSVLITTYNQDRFITETIDGALMQKTDFLYEIVVGDDCSTDNTRNILANYITNYPDKVRVLLHPHNLGPLDSPGKNNFVVTFNACRGKYIAMLEGDDYWTDPLKLQKQVDFLEKNPDFAICFHNMLIMNTANPQMNRLSNIRQKEVTTIEDLAYGNYIFTASCMFRKNFSEMPPWYYQCAIGDYLLHLLNAQYGKIRYLDDVMGVYRVHEQGIWGAKSWIHTREKWVEMLNVIRGNFNDKVNKILTATLHYSYLKISVYCILKGDFKRVKHFLMEIVNDSPKYWDEFIVVIDKIIERFLQCFGIKNVRKFLFRN